MPFDPLSPAPPAVFRNSTAIFLWLFMAGWMGALFYFTRAAAGATDFPGLVIAILAVFWVAGLGFTALALWLPLVRVEISSNGVLVCEQALLWRRIRRFAAKDLSVSGIEKNEDSEGVNYTCSLVLPGGETFILGQGSWRPKVEAERLRLINALNAAERGEQ